MRLPHEPQDLGALRRRYPSAIADLIEAAHVADGRARPPSERRRHVFDCADGLRLIISRDRYGPGRIGVHVSASVANGTTLDRTMRNHDVEIEIRLRTLLDLVVERWQLISGSMQKPELLGLSDGKGVPHFIVWEES